MFFIGDAVVALDERLDARPRFPRQPRQPAGEKHVVLGLEPFSSISSSRAAASIAVECSLPLFGRRSHGVFTGAAGTRPAAATARVRDGTGRSSSSTSGSRRADQLRTDRAAQRVAGVETCAVPERVAVADFAVLGAIRAPAPPHARSRRRVNARKDERDREGPSRGPNSAACRSGSSAASSSAVGSSGRSAYGQNRSSGRASSAHGAADRCKSDTVRMTRAACVTCGPGAYRYRIGVRSRTSGTQR